MSTTTTQQQDSVEAQPAEEEVTYTFKPTEENKTRGITVSLDAGTKTELDKYVCKSNHNHKWMSVSQFVNDALIHYIDGSGSKDKSAEDILSDASWSCEAQSCVNITPTLFNEIDSLVYHPHTPWDTKQEFYICAIFDYVESGMPAVYNRR
jgi:hypothetical protein